MADTWALLAAERQRFVDFLPSIAPDEWEKPSLCTGWTVRDAVAHVVAGAKNNPGKFLVGLIASGFSFDKFIAKGLAKEKGQTPPQLIEQLRGLVNKKTQPAKAMVGEIITHGEDVRRAIGKPSGSYAPEALRLVADAFVKAGAPLRSKGRAAGLKLVATDVSWTHGDGPEVKGSLIDLIMAIAGRQQALGGLSGAGVEQLKGRM